MACRWKDLATSTRQKTENISCWKETITIINKVSGVYKAQGGKKAKGG